MDPRLLHDLFAEVARRHPDALALDVPPGADGAVRQTLTYAELDARSDAVAAYLATRLEQERIVALRMPRGHQLYVAQLGVLKAGGAYTCIDPAFPDARIDFLMGDADPVAVLTAADVDALPAAATPPRPAWLEPDSLAYVIYTSGTTGWPKGVMITHRGIVNLVASDAEYFDLGPGDRVAQGSSAAYDSSVEEAWMAWGVGGTVVVMDDQAARLGPDLVGWLRRERITALCPPPTLLRATGCADPARALPDLRLLYVGGEALPPDVAERWARGRWMENGYGPTECTVTVVRGRIHAGEPVVIGRAVSGNTAHVLDAELEPIPDGEPGELCIAGAGVARGYLNRPELTAERFVDHPTLGRLYRTGDLVRRLPCGDLDCLGRIDSQVKIRGYRVELSAIDAHLAGCEGIREAACTLQDEQLVAFVVASGEPDVEAIRARLATQLPSYMVPAHIARIDALPLLTSGKLDRASLPALELEVAPEGDRVAPRDEGEALVLQAFESVLGRPLSVDADFFAAGGDSMRAARAISMLREHPRTAPATVRDLYEAPSAAGLAACIAGKGAAAPRLVSDRPSGARPALATLLQAGWLSLGLVAGSAVFYALAFLVLPWALLTFGLLPVLLLAPLALFPIAVAWMPISVGLAVLAKRVLIGRYEPGRSPIWGGKYVRHWVVTRFASAIPWGLVRGTIFTSSILRALGARVGERVHIHAGVDLRAGGWDLLTIGDDVTLGRDAALRLVEFHDQAMEIGPIDLGDGAVLDTRAGCGPHTRMGRDAWLTSLSMLPEGGHIPDGERWDGVPAAPLDATPSPPTVHGTRWSPAAAGLALVAARFGVGVLAAVPFYMMAVVALLATRLEADTAVSWLYTPSTHPATLLLLAALLVGSFVVSVFWTALVVRLLGRVHPGAISRWGPAYIRVWLKTGILEAAGLVLSGTLFWPHWLRLAGMQIGPDCEVSTITDVTPELVRLDRACFFADGIYLGPPTVQRGSVTLGAVSFGENTFLGNHVVIPPGSELPSDVLLGVCTVADAERIRPDSAFFGHPAFELPRREVVECDRALTHDPAWYRYLTRVFWESLRFVLPLPLFGVLLVLLKWVPTVAQRVDVTPFFLLALPAVVLAAGASLCLLTLAMKWTLLGRMRPGQHALWSCWCSRWDFLYVAWGAYARPVLANLEGTLMLAWWLRAMGVGVGRRVFLGGGFAQVVDPDMLRFEDEATVGCIFQAHSFEDRVLKLAPVHIRRGATVRPGAVLMYGADIGAGAAVAEHSVVMKHERLLPERYHVGAPTRTATRTLAGARPDTAAPSGAPPG